MREIIKFAFLSLSLVFSNCAFAETPDPLCWEYSNEIFKVSILKSWRIKKNSFNVLHIDNLGSNGEAVSLSFNVARMSKEADLFAKKISFKNDAFAEETAQQVRNRFPDYKILKHGPTTLGNFQAYFIEAEYSLNNLGSVWSLHSIQIYTIRNNFLSIIHFEGTKDYFKKKESEFNLMISSFNYK
ncbi:MAG: hypothetical protein WCQ99_01530 [Pseudomonadota bacterium]